jgi:hypothetical protein
MPMGIGPGLSVTRGGSVTGIGAIGADLALWFDENQAYKSSGGGIVTPDSILTYTAPSPKMVYGSDGVLGYAPHNLFLNSDAPVTQNVTIRTGASYTVTVTGSGSLAGSSGASGTATAGSPATFVATGTTGTFTITGSLTTIQLNLSPAHAGYIATTSAAVYSLPRDYNPTTGAALGVLVEEARTNLLTYSEQFDNAAWTKNFCTITANAIAAPDGATTADLLTNNLVGNNRVRASVTTTNATAYTFSVFVKKGSHENFALQAFNGALAVQAGGVDYNIDTDTLTNAASSSSSRQLLPNGWVRVTLTFTSNDTTTVVFIRVGTMASSGLDDATGYIWGAQLE